MTNNKKRPGDVADYIAIIPHAKQKSVEQVVSRRSPPFLKEKEKRKLLDTT